jgi:hypothetical protein
MGWAIWRDWHCGKKVSHLVANRSDEDVDCVRHAFIRSLKRLISQARAQLQMSRITVHGILWKETI